jgi:plastocyanin
VRLNGLVPIQNGMMQLHPHWQSTGQEDEPPGHAVRIPIAVSSPSRRPAACAGILLFFGIGFFLLRGLWFEEALQTRPVVIRITANGVEPPVVSASAGGEIAWVNDDTVPHVLTSQTMPTTGGPLVTPLLFPGERYSAVLAPDAEPGRHAYASQTSAAIVGDIIVERTVAAIPDETETPVQPIDAFLSAVFSTVDHSMPADVSARKTTTVPSGATPPDSLPIHPFLVPEEKS